MFFLCNIHALNDEYLKEFKFFTAVNTNIELEDIIFDTFFVTKILIRCVSENDVSIKNDLCRSINILKATISVYF